MRLVTAFALLVLVSLSPMSIGQDRAKAFSAQPVPGATLVKRAKFVCGDTPQGYRCRTESGAVRRGKMMKIPNSKPSALQTGLPAAPRGAAEGFVAAVRFGAVTRTTRPHPPRLQLARRVGAPQLAAARPTPSASAAIASSTSKPAREVRRRTPRRKAAATSGKNSSETSAPTG